MGERVAVIGSGVMGSGIAQVCAVSGFNVLLIDHCETSLEKAQKYFSSNLARLFEKGKLTEESQKASHSRFVCSTRLDDISSCSFLIEAIPEKLELKEELIKKIDQINSTAIIASNTSSLSLSKLARFSRYPKRVVGMHFFNPAPVMNLVEVISALQTDPSVVDKVMDFARQLGKTPIRVANRPGFVVNRILLVMLNEAFFAYSEGIAEAKSIDEAMKLGCNHPIGPLALADMVGLDVCLDVCQQFYEQFSDPKYRPCPLLKEMVDAGFLGKKSGRGFYIY